MEEHVDIKLYLENAESVSDLQKTVYQEELNEINEKFPIKKGDMDIRSTFFLKGENTIEVGFFIRSGVDSELSLEDMLLNIEDTNGKIIARKNYNFKDHGVIPKFSGKPFEISFDLADSSLYDESKEYIIKFGAINNVESFGSVETNIENIPENMPFEMEKALRDFERSLPTLKTGEFSISMYELKYNRNRDLCCTLLLRNGGSSEINIQKLPLSIYDKDKKVIARALFGNEEGIVKVNPGKSMIMTFMFPPKAVTAGIHELEGCTVEYK